MPTVRRPPTITVVIPAYNAGLWIDETLASVLAQTRPPEEVIVIDDGSTDDTPDLARAYGEPVRVLQQSNGGPPAAYNRGFDAAVGEYVAMCPADDVWEPRKLEWQAQLLRDETPDVLFGRARYFGLREGDHPHPGAEGFLRREPFLRSMYRADLIATPTAVVRRGLHQRLGRFDESLPSEDYEFWLRALRAGATFYYDPRLVVNLRQHGGNVSMKALEIWEMGHRLRREFAPDVGDPRLTRELLARDLKIIARCRFGAGMVVAARAAYVASLRQRPSAEATLGAALLSVAVSAQALGWLNVRRRRLGQDR